MYKANVLAFSKLTDALKWVALVVAALGVALLFYDLIVNIKKRRRTKLNITAMVFLSLSLVCYVLTTWVFTNLPSLVGFVWIVFLVAYFVCDIILAVGIGRDNRRKKNGTGASSQDDQDDADDNAQTQQDDE